MEIDKGYLSRMLRQLENKHFLSKQVSDKDARVTELSLTRQGHAVINKLNTASSRQIATLIRHLSGRKVTALLSHMQAIQDLLGQKN